MYNIAHASSIPRVLEINRSNTLLKLNIYSIVKLHYSHVNPVVLLA